MARMALCVGINYQGTENELRGCLNDADDWHDLLAAHDFVVTQLKEEQATHDKILTGLTNMIQHLTADDVGVFSFSGHGTWLPDLTFDEPDGRDEALCPYDMGEAGERLILDDELSGIFSKLAPKATLIVLADCCHSGTVYRLAINTDAKTAYRKPRLIPPGHFARDVKSIQQVNRAYGQAKIKSNASLPGVIHFSGCKDSETSADAEINGRSCGAFSYFATRAFGRGIALGQTYKEVYARIRKNLPSWDFQQTPQLVAMATERNKEIFS